MVTLVGALATTGCRVTEPELEVAVQTQDWPQEVLVGDTTELRVTLTDLSSGRGLLPSNYIRRRLRPMGPTA